MKTAYELAMERLNQTAPLKKLTEEQKKRIAETDARYRAKIAEKEIAFQGKIEAARNAGDFEAMEALQQEFARERLKLEEELEAEKEKIRNEA